MTHELEVQKSSEIIEHQDVSTPMQLLSMVVKNGGSREQLKDLMDFQIQWEANEARKAYHKAVSNFKAETINIVKNKNVSFKTSKGTTSYSHSTLDHILDSACPMMAKHGLSHSWTPTQGDGGRITVKCSLTHSLGHSESVELSGSPDDSGTKNNIQRVGSTITYLERYTFLAICGLASKDQDDDGQASGDIHDSPKEEKINYTKVKVAVDFFKAEINKDNFDNYEMVCNAWKRLNEREQGKVFDGMFEQAPGSRKKYKTLLSEYLNYAPTEGAP